LTKVKHSRATRAEWTRTALLRHARQVFARKGFADASTDEMVQRARVTKGALYHHFANKQDIYQAVIEDMEGELVTKLEAAAAACPDRRARLRAMCHAYLDACLDPDLARTLVIEAPVILGWKAWCDIAQSNEVAALARCLSASRVAGFASGEPLETVAQVLLGALNTGARVIATAPDPRAARVQVEETIERLLQGLGLPERAT
jgi:AcrR family transcriptional regulator